MCLLCAFSTGRARAAPGAPEIAAEGVYSAPGVASRGTLLGSVAIVASVGSAARRGHLRAYDIGGAGAPKLLWDAGAKLASPDGRAGYAERPVYTGYPSIDGGRPIPLIKGGRVNLDGVREAARASGVALAGSAREQEALLRWLLGEGRRWRLAPIWGSTPATVSALPRGGLSRARRGEAVVYVASGDGLLHAFRATDGEELFAYLPPNLLPHLLKWWRRVGRRESGASPRLLDGAPRVVMAPRCEKGGCRAGRLLALSTSPAEGALVVLDVTDPVSCAGGSCRPTPRFFEVVAHSHQLSRLARVRGERWGPPAFFFRGGDRGRQVYLAAGAATATRGRALSARTIRVGPLRGARVAPSSRVHAVAPRRAEVSARASSAALVDERGELVALFQGDVAGRVVRFDKDATRDAEVVIEAGPAAPFFFGPAVMRRASETVLAAVSGALKRRVPAEGARLHFWREGKAPLGVALSDLCAASSARARGATCPRGPAWPLQSPLLVYNRVREERYVEIFVLVFAPAEGKRGASYLLRVRATSRGARASLALISSRRFDGRAGGMSVVGGGTDIAVSLPGEGGAPARVAKLRGRALSPRSAPRVVFDEVKVVR